jgi:CDGSH-type Zn-finger protein
MDRKLKSQPSKPLPTRVEGGRPFCGCGLSRTFPFCDSSQMISKTHEPGKLVSCGAGKQAGQSQTQAESAEA